MALQVRVTHALGERLIDLEETGADRPVVVGRAADAAVQVPSAGVGRRHCVLFVLQGQWVVQDTGGEGGTFHNGRPLKKSAVVKRGDVITLGTGAGAPSVTIDPHGLGTGAALEEDEPEMSRRLTSTPAPSFDVSAPPIPAPVAGHLIPQAPAPRPIAYGTPPPGYAPPPQATVNQTPSDEVDWSQVQADSRFYVPKRRSVSPVTVGWVLVLALAALAGVIWAVKNFQDKQRQEEEARRKLLIVRTDAPTTRPTSIPVTTRSAPTSMAAGQPQNKEPEPDPRREEESWRAVERTRYEDPVIGVVKFIDYLEQNPDTPFRADVDKYVEEALDRIWWMRINELFTEIDEANAQIATKQTELKQSQDEQFKKGLELEIKQWSDKRDRASARLRNDMKFAPAEPPNVYDSARLAHFRSQRPEGYYKQWKAEVFDSIKRTKGRRLPWRSAM